jgi:hypothetical protein
MPTSLVASSPTTTTTTTHPPTPPSTHTYNTQLALPLSSSNLASKSQKDLASMVRSDKSVTLDEAGAAVVVDVTRLHRKKVCATFVGG